MTQNNPTGPQPETYDATLPISLQERLTIQGYRSLLADHCQLVDQVANLTQALLATWDSLQEIRNLLATWDSLQEIRNLLDMPRLPLPIAASLALAARPAPPSDTRTTCAPPGTPGLDAAIERHLERQFCLQNDDWHRTKAEQMAELKPLDRLYIATCGDRTVPDKPSYRHTQCGASTTEEANHGSTS